jgi:hypothetical protein
MAEPDMAGLHCSFAVFLPPAATQIPPVMATSKSPSSCLPASNVPLPEAALLPEKDRPVLAAAIHHRCDILITGDRTHFGPLYGKQLQGVLIRRPHNWRNASWGNPGEMKVGAGGTAADGPKETVIAQVILRQVSERSSLSEGDLADCSSVSVGQVFHVVSGRHGLPSKRSTINTLAIRHRRFFHISGRKPDK